ncbi:MAG: hypothetical protein LBK66_12965 [Spirochaetaceae bacterium]|jgi:hypothetical protein|nr:hypothetical protein [Spirochaetaceae bacterium]
MQIDKIIKAVFEKEVNGNCPIIPPFQNYGTGDLGKKTIIKNRRSHLMEIGFAACFIIILGISVFLKDNVLRSPVVNQGAFIEQLFPENPKEAFYDFISAIHSSF